MNARSNYGFQQTIELCKQMNQEITQTISAEFGMNRSNFSNILKEAKTDLDSQIYAYRPRFTDSEISQQPADQLLMFHINPVEFDGIRMQADLLSPKQGDKS